MPLTLCLFPLFMHGLRPNLCGIVSYMYVSFFLHSSYGSYTLFHYVQTVQVAINGLRLICYIHYNMSLG